jgi:hypothetical protein
LGLVHSSGSDTAVGEEIDLTGVGEDWVCISAVAEATIGGTGESFDVAQADKINAQIANKI